MKKNGNKDNFFKDCQKVIDVLNGNDLEYIDRVLDYVKQQARTHAKVSVPTLFKKSS